MTSPRRALVSGGSGSIGAAICRRLAADGHEVYVHANAQAGAAEALAAELRAQGGLAHTAIFDVTDAAAAARVLDGVLAEGPIQILVNNAGIHDDAVFPAMSPRQWSRVFDVSVNGFYHVTQRLILPMIRTRWGRVINISSVASLLGNRGQVNYAAAKGALNSATRSLALEVASRGITVNAVAPGIIVSPMTAARFDAAAIDRLVPIKRPGTPEEVAALVSYLASEQAAYMTGQILALDGGMS